MTTAEPAAATIRAYSAVPTFPVPEIEEAARWYAEHLGFHTAGAFPAEPPHGFASLMRDGAEIMLLRLVGYQKPDLSGLRPEGLWDAYIRTQGVQPLYHSLAGQSFITMPLIRRSYGDWEFEVRDPNGYILVFGGE